MNFEQILEGAQALSDQAIENGTNYPAKKLGLDPRCGWLIVGETWIATTDPRGLDYYGGFEYIEPEHRLILGNLTFYSRESSRVDDAISRLED